MRQGVAMGDLLSIDMLPTWAVLFYVVVSVVTVAALARLRRRPEGNAMGAVAHALVLSALSGVFAVIVYVGAAPVTQIDMADFYAMYESPFIIVVVLLFVAQVVCGVLASRSGKRGA